MTCAASAAMTFAAMTFAAMTFAPMTAAAGPAPAAPTPGAAESLAGDPHPLECVPPIGTNQLIPPLPGLATPLPPPLSGPDAAAQIEALPPAPQGIALPGTVAFHDGTQGFTGPVEVALTGGVLYVRPRGSGGGWHVLPTPECLSGRIVGVSVDGNMLVAVDGDGWIYSLDNLLSSPSTWNWTRSYGAPIWLWPGMTVPVDPSATRTWSLSHRISESFTDAEGHVHPTTAGLVELVSLVGDGSRIIYQDPWLPADYSYEVGAPLGGRFQARSISASGSVVFVMNRFGDMYTRKYDLDIAGANHIPGRYTWQPQGPAPQAPNQLFERFDPQYAAISLPAPGWRHQPKIPGPITGRISISAHGPAVEDRELRVEGRSDGETGYWHKDLADDAWSFTATGAPLASPVLTGADPLRDQSSETLAPPSGASYAGPLPDGWSARTDHFDWAQTEHPVVLTSPGGRDYPVSMYTTDALRLIPRGAGVDAQPRDLEGALDLRGADPSAPGNGELADFIDRNLDGKDVFEIGVRITTDHLAVASQSMVLPRQLGVWTRVPA